MDFEDELYPDINQRVKIQMLNDEDEKVFPSRVEDIKAEGLLLMAPMFNRQPMFLPQGTPVSVSYSDEQAYYELHSNVIRSYRTRPRMVLIEHVDSVAKVQRRRYLRIRALIPVRYRTEEGEEGKGYTKDISGGGLLLRLPGKGDFAPEEMLKLSFQMENQTIQCSAKVVRSEEEEDAHLVGVEFYDISYADRKKIVRWCLSEQLRRAKSGL